jgi:ubiquinone biosynthesis protein UbiJ
MSSVLLARGINYVLKEELWARGALCVHSGKVASFEIGLASWYLEVGEDGFLLDKTDLDESILPNVKMSVALSDVPLMLRDKERMLSYVKITGDADFAQTIGHLVQTVRYDVEHELSQWVGDIAAVQLVSGTKSVIAGMKGILGAVSENVAEYFLEENVMLVYPHEVDVFNQEVRRLRDDVERMEKRIERLEK